MMELTENGRWGRGAVGRPAVIIDEPDYGRLQVRWKEGRARAVVDKEIELENQLQAIMTLLGALAGLDQLANTAGMVPIKGLLQSFTERRMLGVANDHSGPGDRLQNGPMHAQSKEDRADNQPSMKATGHE